MALLLVLKHDLWAMGDESPWYMPDSGGRHWGYVKTFRRTRGKRDMLPHSDLLTVLSLLQNKTTSFVSLGYLLLLYKHLVKRHKILCETIRHIIMARALAGIRVAQSKQVIEDKGLFIESYEQCKKYQIRDDRWWCVLRLVTSGSHCHPKMEGGGY